MERLIGNAVVGQSGGPTAAINATLAGVIKGAYESDEIKVLYGMFNGVEGLLKEKFCNLFEEVAEKNEYELLSSTPAAALGSCRKKLPKVGDDPENIFGKIFEIFKKYDIRYFFYIGGNDSMDTVAKLSEYSKSCDYEMRFIGLPKTIDNDLPETDHTPGFGSAAKYVATTIQEILRDCAVYTTKAVTIVEAMGRDAGWLTGAAGIAKRVSDIYPDYIYLPEVPFTIEKFLSDVEKTFEKHPNVVIVVSEGIKFPDGRYVGEGAQSGATDVFGHKYLAGTAKVLENEVKARFNCKVRSVELNILQRCASHIASKTDIDESLYIGECGVKAAINGESGKMMCFIRKGEGSEYRVEVESKCVQSVANKIKKVPSEFINSDGNYVTDEFIDYVLPLIKGENPVIYKDGIPLHKSIKR